jgi:hypothetical protein
MVLTPVTQLASTPGARGLLDLRWLALTTIAAGLLAAAGANAADCEDLATPAEWGYSPSLSLLPDGRVLLAGGRHHDDHDFLARAEILDLGTRTFTSVAPTGSRRSMHTALVLSDGRVLVAGGEAKPVEVYDPAADRWTRIGSLKTKASGTAVTPTREGKVLIVGGDIGWKGILSNEAWLWNLKGKLQTLESGDSFTGIAFLTRKHGVLFLGYKGEYDEAGSKLWTRNQSTGELTAFDRDRPLIEALSSKPLEGRLMLASDGRLVEPLMVHDGTGLDELRGKKWERTVTFNHDHLDPAVLLLPSGDVVVAGSGDGPLPAELCHRSPSTGGELPSKTGSAGAQPSSPGASDDAALVDKRGGRDFGDRCFVHLQAERWDAAQTACERGLELAKSPSLIGALHYNLGRIAEGRGQLEAARAHYRKSLEVRPDNQPTQARLKALEGR